MSTSIHYKNELLLKTSSATMDDLAEKLLLIAREKSLDPQSKLIQLMYSLMNYGSNIEMDLDSKKEVLQLAQLVDSAIDVLDREEYFKSYDYKENGQIVNLRLDMYRYFAQRLREIAKNEWKDDNLFLVRAYKLRPIAEMLMHFAQAKHLESNSRLMKFLQKLSNREIEDIDIRSKVELEQFIELMELSVQALIDKDYFKQYNITENGKTFNYVLHNYLTYIERLKEVANDWDHTISDEWKQGKVIPVSKEIIYRNKSLKFEQPEVQASTLKDWIKLIFFSLVLFSFMIGILSALVLIISISK